jgi:acyl-CoA synthetase (AMP-forming)/AMP-acid ligase II
MTRPQPDDCADAFESRDTERNPATRPEANCEIGPLSWLETPSRSHGIHFSNADGWDHVTYTTLADSTERAAHGLLGLDVRPGNVVVLIQAPDPAFVAMLFGVWRIGATACLLPPPGAYQSSTQYADFLRHAFAACAPSLVVVDSRVECLVRAELGSGTQCRLVTVAAAFDGVMASSELPPLPTDPERLALIQFTSGSNAPSKAVRVPVSALMTNSRAIQRWLEWTEDDPVASWLPVYHDMGLIACLVTPVVARSDLWLMSPSHFIRDPAKYLRCFGIHGARLTAMPNFALDYIARHVSPFQLEGCDFSEWRALVVGAEPIHPATLERFHARLEPYGFRRETLLPAYGLAEATLAATGVPLREGWKAVLLSDLRTDIIGEAPTGIHVAATDTGTALVCCGPPLEGLQVAILDEAGDALPEGAIGEIFLSGESICDGYAETGGTRTGTFSPKGLRTGDAGALIRGELYVVGRFGDSLKVRGRTLFAEDIERALQACDLGAAVAAATLGLEGGEPLVVVAVEEAKGSRIEATARGLQGKTEGVRLHVMSVPAGTIPRTSSGKVKRNRLWRILGDIRASDAANASGSGDHST